jgi:hypothetical protein
MHSERLEQTRKRDSHTESDQKIVREQQTYTKKGKDRETGASGLAIKYLTRLKNLPRTNTLAYFLLMVIGHEL